MDRGRSKTTTHYDRSDISTYIPEQGVIVTAPVSQKPSNFELRPRRAYRGRAFVGFGNVCPVLHGTVIFPLPPKQEKVYFNVANDGAIDHYDGDPNPAFMDDIKQHMHYVMASLQPERQTLATFLARTNNFDFNREWREKFPFSSHRLHEHNAMHTEGLEIERNAATLHDPSLYLDEVASIRPHAIMSGISQKHGGVKTDKAEIVNWPELELRMAQTTLQNIFNSVERPDADTDFQLRFKTYRNKVAHFLKSGEKWDHPDDYEGKVRELKFLDSYNKFEAWILEEKTALTDLNMLHELWLTNGFARRIVPNSQITRLGHWCTIFFQYPNFKNNRPLVCMIL